MPSTPKDARCSVSDLAYSPATEQATVSSCSGWTGAERPLARDSVLRNCLGKPTSADLPRQNEHFTNQLRLRALFPSSRVFKCSTWDTEGSGSRGSVSSQMAHQCAVDCELRAAVERHTVGNDFRTASTGGVVDCKTQVFPAGAGNGIFQGVPRVTTAQTDGGQGRQEDEHMKGLGFNRMNLFAGKLPNWAAAKGTFCEGTCAISPSPQRWSHDGGQETLLGVCGCCSAFVAGFCRSFCFVFLRRSFVVLGFDGCVPCVSACFCVFCGVSGWKGRFPGKDWFKTPALKHFGVVTPSLRKPQRPLCFLPATRCCVFCTLVLLSPNTLTVTGCLGSTYPRTKQGWGLAASPRSLGPH